MKRKGQYQTRQREELLAYLKTVPDTHITANDVCEYFRSHGKRIGTATVYRHLERMVDEGTLRKYIIDGNSPACFEFAGGENTCCDPACFHCKCQICGALIHLRCDVLSGVSSHLLDHHGFQIDPMRTVFYGVCAQCRAAAAPEEGASH